MNRALLAFALSMLMSDAASAAPAPSPSLHELREWMKEAFTAAGKVPVEERKALAADMVTLRGERIDRIKASLLAIALRPQYFAPYSLLMDMTDRRQAAPGLISQEEFARFDAEQAADRVAAEEFLEELYQQHAGTGSEEALDWQHGLAEFRLTAGRWTDALQPMREVAQYDRDGYTLTLLAVIEKLNGNDAPYAEIAANCPEIPEGFDDGYCVVVARSLANRMRGVGGGKLPPAMEDILTGKATTRVNWGERMHGLYALARSNRNKALGELGHVLADAKAPDWAHDDAIYILAQNAFATQSWAQVVENTDCWMTRMQIEFPPATAETWQRLLTAEREPSEGYVAYSMNGESCFHHDAGTRKVPGVDSACMFDLLSMRVLAAAGTRDGVLFKQTAEQMATIVDRTGKGIRNLSRTFSIGLTSMAPQEGSAERDAALQYLGALPDEESVGEDIENAVRRQTGRVLQPWPSPTTRPVMPCS
jgi:hypothetical protein